MSYEIDMEPLAHHGILGQKWGVRRYQNPDGSLTPAGKKRYDKLSAELERLGTSQKKNRSDLESLSTEEQRKRFQDSTAYLKDRAAYLQAQNAVLAEEQKYAQLTAKPEKIKKADGFLKKMKDKALDSVISSASDAAAKWLTQKLKEKGMIPPDKDTTVTVTSESKWDPSLNAFVVDKKVVSSFKSYGEYKNLVPQGVNAVPKTVKQAEKENVEIKAAMRRQEEKEKERND